MAALSPLAKLLRRLAGLILCGAVGHQRTSVSLFTLPKIMLYVSLIENIQLLISRTWDISETPRNQSRCWTHSRCQVPQAESRSISSTLKAKHGELKQQLVILVFPCSFHLKAHDAVGTPHYRVRKTQYPVRETRYHGTGHQDPTHGQHGPAHHQRLREICSPGNGNTMGFPQGSEFKCIIPDEERTDVQPEPDPAISLCASAGRRSTLNALRVNCAECIVSHIMTLLLLHSHNSIIITFTSLDKR